MTYFLLGVVMAKVIRRLLRHLTHALVAPPTICDLLTSVTFAMLPSLVLMCMIHVDLFLSLAHMGLMIFLNTFFAMLRHR